MTRSFFWAYVAFLLVTGSIALYAIERYQLEQNCSEWGWTYCVPKGESVHHKNSSRVPFGHGWWI